MTESRIKMSAAPIGIRLLPSLPSGPTRNKLYKIFILVFTFLCYLSYHLSRKVISVVKSVLHQNCSQLTPAAGQVITDNATWCDWAPFDLDNYDKLLGSLDYAFLFSYAVAMFCSGHIAERMNLRYFLSLGMVGTGLLTAAFGMGYFWKIHSLPFYIIVQIIGGALQSTGWPSVVTCVGNWYGKGKRGFIMGIWNSHTSVGNILGSIIPGVFVDTAWGWSFVVPGFIIGGLGILTFLFLVPHPADIGCELPNHQEEGFIVKARAREGDRQRHLATPNDGSDDPEQPLLKKKEEKPASAIAFRKALMIPGVIEFAACLFFSKLVSYTFLFWLPKYLKESSNTVLSAQEAADLSTLFDVGGIIGGILAGLISDITKARATTCMVSLALAAPSMYLYDLYGNKTHALRMGLLILTGMLVNGPYALITTAVSADLGTHKSLQGNAKALSTVTAIIDGTGSMGAALGPLLTGLLAQSSWNSVFWMLIAADLAALVVSSSIAIRTELPTCNVKPLLYKLSLSPTVALVLLMLGVLTLLSFLVYW